MYLTHNVLPLSAQQGRWHAEPSRPDCCCIHTPSWTSSNALTKNCYALMQGVAFQLHMWCCRMIKHHPEDALGPHIDWREHSILNNSQFPPEDIAQTAHIHICQVRNLTTPMTICFGIDQVQIFPASPRRQALSKPPDKELPLW